MSGRLYTKPQPVADPDCDLADLRRLEDHLDWMENQRPAEPGRFAWLVSPLLPTIALAIAWLGKMTARP